MKFSNVIFAALLGVGLKANAETDVARKLEGEVEFFTTQAEFEAGLTLIDFIPVVGFEDFNDIEEPNFGPCGQAWVSSAYPGCWDELQPGFSLHADDPNPDTQGNEEIMGRPIGGGRPAIVEPEDRMIIKFKQYVWDVSFFVYTVSGNRDVDIWVEAFAKAGPNNPKKLVSKGKYLYHSGDFVGIIGSVSKIMITAHPDGDTWGGDDVKEEIDDLRWYRRDGRAIYDPHFKTWAGKWFDFMGECDLVMLDAPDFAPDMPLDIHIRTKIRYDYSYIESAVVKIGTETFEVSSFGDYFLNGVANAELPNTISGFAITHEQPSEKEHVFKIQVEDAEEIVLKTFKDMVSVKIDADDGRFHRSQGLMGDFETGKMLARDGTLLEDPDAFGAEWQVRDDEPMLFQTVEGPQYPEACKLPVIKKETRRLGENAALLKAAEMACAKWDEDTRDACIHDVLATGDLDLAAAGAF